LGNYNSLKLTEELIMGLTKPTAGGATAGRYIGRSIVFGIFVLLSLVFQVPTANAHFRLVEPEPWIAGNGLGDPQKMAPCGGTSQDPGTPTNIVTKVQGGSKLHIKIQETVFHPGFYRIALAVNSRSELPPDPQPVTVPTDKGPRSVAGTIQYPPQIPVLADGLFQHTALATAPWETDVQLPNITCAKCTLQVIQFMAQHMLNKDGDYTYHHCADLQITADPSKPVDEAWMARGSAK
jgi:hypothetical protein